MAEKVKNFLASDQFFLMFAGILIGVSANSLISAAVIFFVNPILNILMLLFCIASPIFALSFYRRVRMRRSKKARFIFLGISLTSLSYALVDFLIYCFGFKGIKMSWDPPYLWFGDIPFISLLSSLFLGSLFSVLERMLDIFERA
jgi:hypothetical protein